MTHHTPEQRVVSIVNHLDQAAAELSYLEREAPRGMVTKLRKQVEGVQQMAGRDLAREFSLPSSHYASSNRVAARFVEREASSANVLWEVLDRRAFIGLYREMVKAGDGQSAQLLRQVSHKLSEALELSNNEEMALNRLWNCVDNAGRWSPDLQRNNIFKAADLLGIKLPSGMF